MSLPRLRLATACLLGVFATVSTGCGGRTQLVPAYQIGRLSSDAIVANHAGVRVMVRTAAWPDPLFGFGRIHPLEITFDNASSYPLEVSHRHITLVTDSGQRISVIPPAELSQIADSEFDNDVRLPIDQMRDRALVDAVLPRDRRRTGFVYFETPNDAEQLNLEIDFLSAESGTQFGTITISFFID